MTTPTQDTQRITRLAVDKYNRPGPRYTSYPTAPVWTDEVSIDNVEQRLQAMRSGTDTTPLSFYLHIPFCREICHFCGCNTYRGSDPKNIERYLDHLKREIELFAERVGSRNKVLQIHWGGGTPTFLSEPQISALCHTLFEHFPVRAEDDPEVAIELDPRVTTFAQLALLRELGFNRVSLGVQDFDPEVQKASNRIQPIEQTRSFFEQCRKLGFTGINLDLIYGLPQQNPASFAKTVEEVIRWRPDRIALFSYAHVPWLKPYQRKINADALPTPDAKFQTFIESRTKFIEAGYEVIGMDHFAVPEDELAVEKRNARLRRNFQGYTVKPETAVLALGITGISDLGDLYFQNHKKFNHYFDAIAAGRLAVHRGCRLSKDDLVRRFVITQLMCNFSLDRTQVEQRFNLKFATTFADELGELEAMVEDAFVEIGADTIKVLPMGQLFIRNIAMVFDAYLKRAAADRPIFSKTV